jgi:putative ABC transport system permease protein
MGVAGSLALALLAGGCVLAAIAGPRLAQATGTRALQQTMDGLIPPLDTVVVSSNWATINGYMASASAVNNQVILSTADLDDATTQLRRDFGGGPLPLASRSADWAGMSPGLYYMSSTLPVLKGIPAKIEVSYRYPTTGQLRLVAGSMPDTVPQDTAEGLQAVNTLNVVITTRMARAFALRPGSQIVLSGPVYEPTDNASQVRLDVTGVVEPTDPNSSFWSADPLLPGPALAQVGGSTVWEGSVIADPGELDALQQIFGQRGLDIQWELPVNTTGLHGQAQALSSQLNQITNRTPELTGRLAPMANALTVSSALVQPLAALVQASNAVNVLLWMVYVGLAAAGGVMLFLAGRMIAARRSAELSLLRARGASVWQLFCLGSLGAAVACVPAAGLAWAVAVLLVPHSAPAGPAAWWPGIATVAISVTGPGVATAWDHRPRRRRARRPRRWVTRVVVEATASAAAIGGIALFRTQTGAGDLFTSAAPLLVAVPAVIVILRLYQLLLHGLARALARQRGVIGFLGLTRSAQATATVALPLMTLVLVLTVAVFTGMLRDAVVRGETAVSWRETGADAVIAPPGQQSIASAISPQAVRAITAVPGVQHAATALELPWTIAGGGQVTVIAVDPVSYAALVASAPGFSPVHPGLLTEPHGHGAIPVLASPQAAAYLGAQHDSAALAQQGLPTLRVRVSGELQSTPALPAGGAFIVLPLSAIRGVGQRPAVNLVLLNGPSIDMTRLDAVAQAAAPGADALTVITRSSALLELTGAPLQQGTFLLFTLAIVFAAALALAVLLLELALGTQDRELTMARLATMGLAEGQRVRLVMLEVLPAIAAAAVAAVACAIALPRLVAPAIDLSAFTQSQAPVPLGADFRSFLLPLAGLLVVTVIALGYEIRSGRGRVAVAMRA